MVTKKKKEIKRGRARGDRSSLSNLGICMQRTTPNVELIVATDETATKGSSNVHTNMYGIVIVKRHCIERVEHKSHAKMLIEGRERTSGSSPVPAAELRKVARGRPATGNREAGGRATAGSLRGLGTIKDVSPP